MNRLLIILILVAPLYSAVDLVTLPRRDATQLTIYNSVDLTMVRESRTLTVRKGINCIQFSWANTLIDPTSIDFRMLSHQSEVTLRETTYPHDRNEALQWNIHSEINGSVQVEIRYFTSGITWSASYAGIAEAQEKELSLKGYVRVINNSGEEYDNAQVRLVVGKINLVESIIELARQKKKGDVTVDEDKKFLAEAKEELCKAILKCANDIDAPAEKQKSVEKKGLSEYFLFTIEGRETIHHQQPVQLLALDVKGAALEPLYRCSDRRSPQQFIKIYRVKNEKLADSSLSDMKNLGIAPIPDGLVMLYSEYANKDLAFMGSSQTSYVPIGARLESELGLNSDISLCRRVLNRTITDIVARQYKRRIDTQWVLYYDLVDFNSHEFRQEEVINGQAQTVKCEIERRFEGQVLLKTSQETPHGWEEDKEGVYVDFSNYRGVVEKVDNQHIKIHLDLQAGEKRMIDYVVTTKLRKQGPELHPNRVREPQ